MTTSIVEVIQHYQRSIDNSQDNEARLLHCIQKLYKLPIKVEHLQETGVGKTVNSLRKFNGEIGVAAKTLVTKWKAMVAAEEEPMDTTPHSNDNETQDDNNNNDDDDQDPSPHNGVDEEHDENENRHNSTTQHSGHNEKDKHKERKKERSHSSGSTHHKENSSKHLASSSSSSSKHTSDKHKSSSSSSREKEGHHRSGSSSSKEREKEKTEHKARDRHRDKDQEKAKEQSEKHKAEKDAKTKTDTSDHKNNNSNGSKSKSDDKHNHQSSSKDKEKERSGKHKSSSKDKERIKEEKSSSSSSKDKHDRKSSSSSHKSSPSSAKDSSETAERKRPHNSDTESSDFKSPQPKVAKVDKTSNASVKTVDSSSPTADEDVDDCFDSSTGANFGDILGMLNVTVKKGKKSSKSSISSAGANSKDSPVKASTSNKSTPPKVNGLNSTPSIYTPLPMVKPPTAKPDLLAPTAKLEPLDPSIALELPTISTNYKPMPLNQTVMDCVFNTASSSSSKPVRTLTDAEALQHGISSKTIRTKVYSGTRTGQIFQVSSLFDMCIRILQKNIDALEYTGGVPFEVLRPVLERATPQQLFIFEDYNPYLMEDSDVLWQFHVSRNYRTQKRLENESWREMFLRCQEEEERRLSILKDSIKQSQKIAAAPVRKTQLAFVDSMVKPPRNVMRKQEQYGTKSKLVATPAARVASLQSVTPNAGRTGDQRLKVPAAVRDHAQVSNSNVRPKKAPLMQKTLAFIRGRLKR